MNLSDFDYALPKELVAQSPLAQRDASKLLVVDRKNKTLTDRHFFDLSDLIPSKIRCIMSDIIVC